jgi:hypothetical protein
MEPTHHMKALWHNKRKTIINKYETAFSLLPFQDTGIRKESAT